MSGSLIEADTTAAEGLELFPQFTDLVLAQARIAQMQGDTDKAVALFHRAIEMGDAPARYGPMVGSGTFLARLALAELHLELGEAAAGACRAAVVRREPSRVPGGRRPVRVGAAARRRRPRRGGRRAREARRAARRHPPDGGRRSCSRPARADEAEAQYRLALEAAPADARARHEPGRAAARPRRLGRGRRAGRRACPPMTPTPALAVRIELCSLIGRADADTVQAALAARHERRAVSRRGRGVRDLGGDRAGRHGDRTGARRRRAAAGRDPGDAAARGRRRALRRSAAGAGAVPAGRAASSASCWPRCT